MSSLDAALARAADASPAVRRLAVAALFQQAFSGDAPISRQALAAIRSCLSSEHEVKTREASVSLALDHQPINLSHTSPIPTLFFRTSWKQPPPS